MKIVGITGGVGAGKSEVMRLLTELLSDRCYILIADEAAHQVEKKGEDCYDRLVELMSKDILSEDGEIDKGAFAAKLFSDPTLREQVNSIVHPAVKRYIRKEIERQLREGKTQWFFIEAALLIEDGYEAICDELWYVWASEEVRRKRLSESRGYSREKIDHIFASQNTEEIFRAHCQVVIENNGELSETKRQLLAALSEERGSLSESWKR
ncbi:MAG: dephospho-CoA kinase [Lachnospiraceae bacterium]|nr:dephospho-CoA kinase [Lachnospiraceae bacterium]